MASCFVYSVPIWQNFDLGFLFIIIDLRSMLGSDLMNSIKSSLFFHLRIPSITRNCKLEVSTINGNLADAI